MTRFLVASLALQLAACGTDAATDEPPRVQLGTGALMFEPLRENDDIFVVQGPQGGYHILGSVRAAHLDPGNENDINDPDNPTTEFQMFVGTERVDGAASRYRQGLVAGDNGYEMIGRLVILDIDDDDELTNLTVRVVVTIQDADGKSASDSRSLRAVPHPNNR